MASRCQTISKWSKMKSLFGKDLHTSMLSKSFHSIIMSLSQTCIFSWNTVDMVKSRTQMMTKNQKHLSATTKRFLKLQRPKARFYGHKMQTKYRRLNLLQSGFSCKLPKEWNTYMTNSRLCTEIWSMIIFCLDLRVQIPGTKMKDNQLLRFVISQLLR